MNWEWITRRLLVLANYGYSMEFFDKYIDDPNFLTVEWLENWYGGPIPHYVIEGFNEVDQKMGV